MRIDVSKKNPGRHAKRYTYVSGGIRFESTLNTASEKSEIGKSTILHYRDLYPIARGRTIAAQTNL
jgi:hypothetical protein